VSADPSPAAPASIDAVIARMEEIESTLDPGDGVRYFNRLYLNVTREIRDALASTTFEAPVFLDSLDVTFANLYFEAFDAVSAAAECPTAWAPLFEHRTRTRVTPIQFALAGMDAHISHDLPLAVITTATVQAVEPFADCPYQRDFFRVNDAAASSSDPSASARAGSPLARAATWLSRRRSTWRRDPRRRGPARSRDPSTAPPPVRLRARFPTAGRRRAPGRRTTRPTSQLLTTSFILVPAPAGPSHSIREPTASKIGVQGSLASSGPDASTVSWPCSAGCLVPSTGASTNVIPCSAASRSSASVASIPIVEDWIQLQARTSNPAAATLRAIGPPITPVPITATTVMFAPLPGLGSDYSLSVSLLH